MSGGPLPIWKKYTTGSIGIWETIRQALTLVPNRSSGNPIVTKYRVPPPGSNKTLYKEPISIPAGNIIENNYFKRDSRRNYPKISSFNQNDVSLLLNLGSRESPKFELVGEDGNNQLKIYQSNDSPIYLNEGLKSVDLKAIYSNDFNLAPNLNLTSKNRLKLVKDNGVYSGQDKEYPCRLFTFD
ncbi:hypothetical protein WICMUC_002331 [Wickerhamomyces mucosus]|uniref:Uncharacterized protein n=1 Tax=Wickerhamomyces mucosus TaxID=1378264 RepID=A0A9P8PR37_9ASCO|nr:hypothetical protein WICMUC_002331 [Wickerhamomyces mucosus]